MNHHRKEHSLLLISQLFEARQRLSPFTVILDSLEQSGRSLVEEFILRAKVGFFFWHSSSRKNSACNPDPS